MGLSIQLIEAISSGEKHECPYCGRHVKVTRAGKLARHGYRRGSRENFRGGGHCPISGKSVDSAVAATVKELRADANEMRSQAEKVGHPSRQRWLKDQADKLEKKARELEKAG